MSKSTTAHNGETDNGNASQRLRRELILAGILILVGIAVLPFAIFQVGQRLLGEYSADGAGVLHLYGQILRDMGSGSAAAWILVLSPWLGIVLLRVLWWPFRSRQTPAVTSDEM